jgi:transcriptional regulator with GAF, ATPase, and Fis domain
VGGNRVIPTDVRIIAAANRDLAAAISAGEFRADLFYRLNVFPIHVPPLRKRKEDIPMLVEYFVKRYAEKARKQISKIDENTLKLCQSYPWPGNIGFTVKSKVQRCPVTPERWTQIEELFHHACERDSKDRDAFLGLRPRRLITAKIRKIIDMTKPMCWDTRFQRSDTESILSSLNTFSLLDC